MPIYEYQCNECHHHFDVIQKINDEPVKTCPACSKDTAVRLVSAAGFQLKGSGWYVTDFKSKDKTKPSSAATDVKSTSETSSSSTDSKSTTTSESEKG